MSPAYHVDSLPAEPPALYIRKNLHKIIRHKPKKKKTLEIEHAVYKTEVVISLLHKELNQISKTNENILIDN